MTTTIELPVAIENVPGPAAEPSEPRAAASETETPETGSGPSWAAFHALEERLTGRTNRRDTWTIAMFVFAAFAVLFGVVAMGLGSRAVDQSERNIRSATAAAPAPAIAAAAAPAVSPVAVTLSDMQVQSGSTTIAAGNVTFRITNTGSMQHELLVFRSDLAPADYPMKDGNINEDGPGITKVSDGDNLNPGTSQNRVVDLTQPGTYMLVCNLPGHFKMGMYRVITVK